MKKSVVAQMLREHAKFIGKKIDELKDKESGVEVARAIGNQTIVINKAFLVLKTSLKKLENPSFDVIVDFKPLKEPLSALVKEAKKLNKRKELNLTVIESRLANIEKALGVRENKVVDKLEEMWPTFKENKPKKTMRIDEDQLNKLAQAIGGGGGGIATVGGQKTASTYTITTLTLTSANTEYEFTFPKNTIAWTFKLRNAGDSLYYASVTGKLPSSGDNSDYQTLLPGLAAFSLENVEWGGKKMFFESNGAGNIIEFTVSQL